MLPKLNLSIIFCGLLLFLLSACNSPKNSVTTAEEKWENLFNGSDLDGWTPKFAGSEYGVNYKNTFRAGDGVIEVNYDEYEGFNNEFGHLFYKTSYENYHLKLEYRFKGEQVSGGPGWAFRNSGIMFHTQDPSTMRVEQDFPICLEFQFLGGNGVDERSTGNLCTPSSHVKIDGELVTTHCISSSSPTYHGDDWVTAELIVYSDKLIHHIIESDTVFTYTDPIYDIAEEDSSSGYESGEPITSGYFALQAESHPLEFRNIMIKKLK